MASLISTEAVNHHCSPKPLESFTLAWYFLLSESKVTKQSHVHVSVSEVDVQQQSPHIFNNPDELLAAPSLPPSAVVTGSPIVMSVAVSGAS